MSKIYSFKTADGKKALPVGDNTYFTDFLSYSEGVKSTVFIEYFSDEEMKNPVTPTAGTTTIESSPLGNVFLSPVDNGVVNAVDVSFPDGTYTPPVIDDLAFKAKITTLGITGANFMKAVVFVNHG